MFVEGGDDISGEVTPVMMVAEYREELSNLPAAAHWQSCCRSAPTVRRRTLTANHFSSLGYIQLIVCPHGLRQ
jgi:hypothetical protein